MKDLLKKVFTNVELKDETGKVLLNQSNLFVESGRILIRDILAGTVVLDVSKYAIEFGSSAQVPAESDVDIVTPFNPIAASTSYTISSGPFVPASPTEMAFIFSYTNGTGGNVTFKELGLFYRPLGPPVDGGTPPRPDSGVLLARLKTTYTSITIGSGKNITVTWKFIF